jgi:hypothetical protein
MKVTKEQEKETKRDVVGMKMCPMCKKKKTLEKFALDSSKKDGRRSICRACNVTVSSRYRNSVKGVACDERHNKVVQRRIENDDSFAQRRRDIVNASTARPEYKEHLHRKAHTKHGMDAKAAHSAVEDAIRSGELRVPRGCKRCGVNPGKDKLGRRKLRAIHINGYAPENRLDVEFMCPTCVNRLTKVARLT